VPGPGLADETPRGAILVELRRLGKDPEAAWAQLSEFAEWLTLGLVNVVNLLGPQLVVLGDLLTVLPESVLERVSDEVRRRSLVSRAVGGTRIVSSVLGVDVKLLGAAEVAFEQVLDTV